MSWNTFKQASCPMCRQRAALVRPEHGGSFEELEQFAKNRDAWIPQWTTSSAVDCTCFIAGRDFADEDKLSIGLSCRNAEILLWNELNQPAAMDKRGEYPMAL